MRELSESRLQVEGAVGDLQGSGEGTGGIRRDVDDPFGTRRGERKPCACKGWRGIRVMRRRRFRVDLRSTVPRSQGEVNSFQRLPSRISTLVEATVPPWSFTCKSLIHKVVVNSPGSTGVKRTEKSPWPLAGIR